MLIIIPAAVIKHTTSTETFLFILPAFVLLVLQSSSFCRVRSWNDDSRIWAVGCASHCQPCLSQLQRKKDDILSFLHEVRQRSSPVFWPLKCAFDQLSQIPLRALAVFLCRRSGKSNQLLFLAYWFSLSQPTGGIKLKCSTQPASQPAIPSQRTHTNSHQ